MICFPCLQTITLRRLRCNTAATLELSQAEHEERKARALAAAATELGRLLRKEDFGRMKIVLDLQLFPNSYVIGQFNVGFIVGTNPFINNLTCSRALWDKRSVKKSMVMHRLQGLRSYVFKIMGGCDKKLFPLKQGVLTPGCVRLLLHGGVSCFQGHGRRNSERRRNSGF
ncbi:uncharacterized protein LOC133718496 isoform X2 [Rosa rugosa]|nr:uncharacterized protein LOC133718496 isoform X2 [Rosa rugosa]